MLDGSLISECHQGQQATSLHNRPDIRLQPCLLYLHTYEFLQSGRRPYKDILNFMVPFLPHVETVINGAFSKCPAIRSAQRKCSLMDSFTAILSKSGPSCRKTLDMCP